MSPALSGAFFAGLILQFCPFLRWPSRRILNLAHSQDLSFSGLLQHHLAGQMKFWAIGLFSGRFEKYILAILIISSFPAFFWPFVWLQCVAA
jgi:hypothetical protein